MIEVISTGPSACFQDLGRPGFEHLGVSRGGAADLGAHRLANRLVGNAESAATIEFTLGGLAVRLHAAATIALTGARCPGAPWSTALTWPAGRELRLGVPGAGLRSYLAVRGGFSVAPVLGSRSTDTLAGLGPEPLRAGDRLRTGTDARTDPADEALLRSTSTRPLKVILGPREDWFEDPAALLHTRWQVRADSNRIGIRLEGPPLARYRIGELPSEATLPGAIQVPPDGRPILLFRDAPVTGGYPVIAVLHSSELDRLAQLRPGELLSFRVD